MKTCQSTRCQNPATWTRPKAIAGCSNELCDLCFIRIYSGFSHHTANWERITETAPQEQPATVIPAQTELF
jgi:hypothetical protein